MCPARISAGDCNGLTNALYGLPGERLAELDVSNSSRGWPLARRLPATGHARPARARVRPAG